MLGKNNVDGKLRKVEPQKQRFSIRKFAIGAASVVIGLTFMGMGNQTVKADTVPASVQVKQSTENTNSTTAKDEAVKDDASTNSISGNVDANKKVEVTKDTTSTNNGKTDDKVGTSENTNTNAEKGIKVVAADKDKVETPAKQNDEVNTKTESPKKVVTESDVSKQDESQALEKKTTDKQAGTKSNEVKVDADKLATTKSDDLTDEQLSELLGTILAAESSTDKTNSDYISYGDAQRKVNHFNSSIDTQLKNATNTTAINELYKAYEAKYNKTITPAEKTAINEAVSAAIQDALSNEKKIGISTAPTSSDIADKETEVKNYNDAQIKNINDQIKNYINHYAAYEGELQKYNAKKANYIEQLKQLGLYTQKDTDLARLSQLLSLQNEPNAKVSINQPVKDASLLKDEMGNPLLTHLYSAKNSTNTNFLTVTYTNLSHSTYGNEPISKIVVTYSNLNQHKKGTNSGIYFGNNPIDGFFYTNTDSVTMDLQFYDSNGYPIDLPPVTKNAEGQEIGSYITIGSLNSRGTGDDYIEKATLLSDGEGLLLPGSSVTVNTETIGKKECPSLYSKKNNEVISGSDNQSINLKEAKRVWSNDIINKYSYWDTKNKDKAIFGSGLFRVSGNDIKIQYSNGVGSAWATFSTTIPKMPIGDAPTPPDLSITWNPSKLSLDPGQDTSRTKRVQQVIHYRYHDANGKDDGQAAPDYKGKDLVFTQKGTKDLYTGKTTWDGSWTETKSFVAQESPKEDEINRSGYHIEKDEYKVIPQYDITVTNDNCGDNLDKEDWVYYVADPVQPNVPTPVPNTPPTTPKKDPQPEPHPTTPSKTPDQPTKENKEVVPTPAAPKAKVVVTPTATKKETRTVSVAKKAITSKKATPAKKVAAVEKQATLPQTGAKDENLVGMLGLMIASVGAIFGLAVGKKHKND